MSDAEKDPHSQRRATITAALLLSMIAVLWGANWPIMKVGLSEIPPWVFRATASAYSAIGLFIIAKMSGQSLYVPKADRVNLVICAMLNMALWNILILYGIALMDSGRAAILAYTMPLWASLTGVVLLKEKLSPRAIMGLALGLAGMGALFSVGDNLSMDRIWGPVLVVLAAMCWGAGTAFIKYAQFSMPVTVTVAWQHFLGAVPIAAVALLYDVKHIDTLSFWPVMAVVYNMTVTGIVCYMAYFKVVTMLPVVASTVGTLMVPVLGVFFNALIFNVTPVIQDYIALGCVAIAVALVMIKR